MSDDQNDRFKFINHDDPSEHDKVNNNNITNKPNEYVSNFSIMGIQGGLGWRAQDKDSFNNSRSKMEQLTEEEKQKDRKIKKLTNINKHLLQQLKLQNDELTKRVNKQKFKVPKKSTQRPEPKSQQISKQLEGTKRQLENAYRQIEYYKQTISGLKAKQIPTNDKQKLNQMVSKLKQKNDQIESLQQEIKTQKIIKQIQNKELFKINNDELIDVMKRLDEDIKVAKQKLKEAKKTLSKRQELEKKQHAFLGELEALIKRKKQEEDDGEEEVLRGVDKKVESDEDEIPESQWRQVKDKLAIEKKKYDEYGKKLTYHNYMKSKQSKQLEQLELKYKQKVKTLQKLKSKLTQVNKLARIIPKPQILQRVDVKMSKLKDIISRQNTIQLESINKSKNRVQSEDVRQFKKWELQHARRQIDNDSSQLKFIPNNQSSCDDEHELLNRG